MWHSVVRSLIRTRICDPMNCSMPGSFVLQYLPEFAQIYIHRVGDATQPFCPLLPLLLLPSVFPIIRVFSSEPTLHIGWPNYWSFSFSRSPSSEYSGLISFRIDSIDLLAVQGTLKSFLSNQSSKTLVFSLLYGSTLTSIQDYWKKHVKGREGKRSHSVMSASLPLQGL